MKITLMIHADETNVDRTLKEICNVVWANPNVYGYHVIDVETTREHKEPITTESTFVKANRTARIREEMYL